MVKSRAYRATAVKSVVLAEVVRCREGQAVRVGADIGKGEVFAVARWADGEFERPWKAKNPGEIRTLVELLRGLSQGRAMQVGMESSGTYGEALRQALTDARLEVRRVSGKAVHDYAEIFDGVPSQHDGKDAAIVAELVALGKSSSWPYETPSDADSEMGYWVEWLDAQQRVEAMGLNLRERSSGKYQGKRKITKRGSAIARRWLYFAAMRQCQHPSVRGWYEAKKRRDKDRGEGALIGIARKLALALHRVAVHEEPFEAWRLFPGHLDCKQQSGAGPSVEALPAECDAGGPPPDPRDLSHGANPGDKEESGASCLAPSPVLAPERRSGRVPAEPYPPPSPRHHSTSQPRKERKR